MGATELLTIVFTPDSTSCWFIKNSCWFSLYIQRTNYYFCCCHRCHRRHSYHHYHYYYDKICTRYYKGAYCALRQTTRNLQYLLKLAADFHIMFICICARCWVQNSLVLVCRWLSINLESFFTVLIHWEVENLLRLNTTIRMVQGESAPKKKEGDELRWWRRAFFLFCLSMAIFYLCDIWISIPWTFPRFIPVLVHVTVELYTRCQFNFAYCPITHKQLTVRHSPSLIADFLCYDFYNFCHYKNRSSANYLSLSPAILKKNCLPTELVLRTTNLVFGRFGPGSFKGAIDSGQIGSMFVHHGFRDVWAKIYCGGI